MSSKTERRVDAELERIGVRPYVYHIMDTGEACDFRMPFEAITIALPEREPYEKVVEIVDRAIARAFCFTSCLYNIGVASQTLNAFRSEGVPGVAICDPRDNFSRARGRIIAKGRLLKQLKAST